MNSPHATMDMSRKRAFYDYAEDAASPPQLYAGRFIHRHHRNDDDDDETKYAAPFHELRTEFYALHAKTPSYPPPLPPLRPELKIAALRRRCYSHEQFQKNGVWLEDNEVTETFGDLFLNTLIFEVIRRRLGRPDNFLYGILKSNALFAVFSEFYQLPAESQALNPASEGQTSAIKPMADLWEAYFGAMYQDAKVGVGGVGELEDFFAGLMGPLVPFILRKKGWRWAPPRPVVESAREVVPKKNSWMEKKKKLCEAKEDAPGDGEERLIAFLASKIKKRRMRKGKGEIAEGGVVTKTPDAWVWEKGEVVVIDDDDDDGDAGKTEEEKEAALAAAVAASAADDSPAWPWKKGDVIVIDDDEDHKTAVFGSEQTAAGTATDQDNADACTDASIANSEDDADYNPCDMEEHDELMSSSTSTNSTDDNTTPNGTDEEKGVDHASSDLAIKALRKLSIYTPATTKKDDETPQGWWKPEMGTEALAKGMWGRLAAAKKAKTLPAPPEHSPLKTKEA